MIWRIFFSVRENFSFFHTVQCAQCGNYGNLLSRFFGKSFVKVTVLLKKLLNSWFDEIFLGDSEFSIFPHCVNRFKMKVLLMYVLYFPHLGYRLLQLQDSYPWTNCNAFESTKKNCPRGEACLKLKNHKSYAWNWAMRCK